MEKPKRSYETTFIVNASLDDAQIENVIARVQDTITKNGGEITSVNKWGRKRLAYTINKKTNGFYVNMEFIAPSTLLGLLERSYQLDEMILRYLTVALDSKSLAAKSAIPAPVQAETPAPVPAREPLFKEEGDQTTAA